MRASPRALAIVFGVTLLGLGAWSRGCAPRSLPSTPALDDRRLEAALAGARLAEARLVGVAFLASGSEPSDQRWKAERRRTALRIEAALARQRSPEHLRLAAIVRLLSGRLDSAVGLLQEACESAPADAALWSDLSATLLNRARAQRGPSDLALALAAADRAVALRPGLAEARFNRALALERLFLMAEAESEWDRYLEIDREPGWRDEALRHRSAPRQATEVELWTSRRPLAEVGPQDPLAARSLAGAFPQQARELAEEELLGTWATALRDGRGAAATAALSTARALGAGLADLSGETMTRDAVAAVDDAMADGLHPARIARLAAGHHAYAEGLSFLERGDIERAASRFTAARLDMALAGTPFVGWAAYQLARCQYQHAYYSDALKTLATIPADSGQRKYPALHGRCLWLQGLIQIIQGHPSESLDAYRKAILQFEHLRENGNIGRLEGLIAADLRYLGDITGAWGHLFRALKLVRSYGAPTLLISTSGEAALASIKLGAPSAGLHFQDDVVRHARQSGPTLALAGALQELAAMQLATAHPQRAAITLEEGRQVAAQVRDARYRQTVEGDILVLKGEQERARDPERAIATLGRAVRLYRATEFHYRLARVLVERGLAYAAAARYDEAEADLSAAIQEYERQRIEIPDGLQRTSYLDQQRRAFEQIILFEVEQRGQADRALDFSERGRARTLLDWVSSPRPPPKERARSLVAIGHPRDSRSLQTLVPDGVTIVEYMALDDRLLTWAIRREQLTFREIRVGRAPLARHIEELRAAIRAGSGAALSAAGAALFDVLVRPVSGSLRSGDAIVFVPDGVLHQIPFAALVDRASGRFLVADRAVAVAPSATAYVNSLHRDREIGAAGEVRALLVADPAFDRSLFPDLPELHNAMAEARQVGALFPGSRLLAHGQATRTEFLAVAGDFQIVHYGGHAIADLESPLLSQLLFSAVPEKHDPGVLCFADILGHRFARTRLVVLSACGSAAGRISATEGSTGLAYAFLTGQVPAVVAALWNVDDDAACRFFALFYRELRAGRSALAALHAAQLAAIASPDAALRSPAAWAGFELFGESFTATAHAGHPSAR